MLGLEKIEAVRVSSNNYVTVAKFYVDVFENVHIEINLFDDHMIIRGDVTPKKIDFEEDYEEGGFENRWSLEKGIRAISNFLVQKMGFGVEFVSDGYKLVKNPDQWYPWF